MIRLKYYLALFLLLLPICSYGQFFKRLGMKDGLSNPSVLAINKFISVNLIWLVNLNR